MDELDFEKRVRLIEGCTLARVWYETMPSFGTLREFSEFHTVTDAIYFENSDKSKFKVTWSDELGYYHGFGVSIKPVRAFDSSGCEDATGTAAWQACLGSPIVYTTVHWQRIIDNMRSSLTPVLGMGYLRREDYPQCIELGFENGQKVFLNAMRVTDERKGLPFTNYLTVFFSLEMMGKYYKPLRKW
jgi:hypothetical protein